MRPHRGQPFGDAGHAHASTAPAVHWPARRGARAARLCRAIGAKGSIPTLQSKRLRAAARHRRRWRDYPAGDPLFLRLRATFPGWRGGGIARRNQCGRPVGAARHRSFLPARAQGGGAPTSTAFTVLRICAAPPSSRDAPSDDRARREIMRAIGALELAAARMARPVIVNVPPSPPPGRQRPGYGRASTVVGARSTSTPQ